MTESEQRVQFYKDMDKLLKHLEYDVLIEISKALGIHKHIAPNQSISSTIHDISNRCLVNGIPISKVKAVVDHVANFTPDIVAVINPTSERLAWLDARINDQRNEIAKNILTCERPNLTNLIAATAVELQGRGLLLNSYLQEKAILLGVKNV